MLSCRISKSVTIRKLLPSPFCQVKLNSSKISEQSGFSAGMDTKKNTSGEGRTTVQSGFFAGMDKQPVWVCRPLFWVFFL